MSNIDQVLNVAFDWLSGGQEIALATVVKTWGSAPRPVGSQLVINKTGAFEGSVSGGCVEGAVIEEAIATIEDGQVRNLNFGVTNEEAWEVGLACGGEIRIFVQKIEDKHFLRNIAVERPLTLVTNLESGENCIVRNGSVLGNLSLNTEMIKIIKSYQIDDQSQLYDLEGSPLFFQVLNKPLRMLIIGAVHISQELAPMAQRAGFQVTVADPRTSFATGTRFPDINLVDGWPDDVVKEFAVDDRSAVITLTHDPKLDDPAIETALKSKAFYIGSLGGRKTHLNRKLRLSEKGFSEKEINRISGPIGLDLGAISPAEIAISILAEIIATKHNKLLDQ